MRKAFSWMERLCRALVALPLPGGQNEPHFLHQSTYCFYLNLASFSALIFGIAESLCEISLMPQKRSGNKKASSTPTKKKKLSQPLQPELSGLKKSDKKLKSSAFGGTLLKGNPREKRPLSSKHSMHLVLRSSMAKGALRFNHPGRLKQLKKLLFEQAEKHGITIYELSINSNHIHLLLKIFSKEAYRAFIKSATGLIARKVLKRERGLARSEGQQVNENKQRFWDHRPWTRLVAWGRSFHEAKFYVIRNRLEAIGYLDYLPRHVSVPKIKVLQV